MDGLIVGGGLPPPTDTEETYAPAAWVSVGRPARVVILGTVLVAVPTHWADGRTRVCGVAGATVGTVRPASVAGRSITARPGAALAGTT